MPLLSYSIWTLGPHHSRVDLLYKLECHSMDEGASARLDRIWHLIRSKVAWTIAVFCTPLTDRPYQPYSAERKAKLRATLDRKKVEKQQAALREAYPLLADTLIETEKVAPYTGKKDRRSRYHRMKDKYQQAMRQPEL